MNVTVLYGSKYGHARAYAERFAALAGTKAIDCTEDFGLTNDADKVVFFGGVYAGSVRGLKRAFRRVPVSAETIVVTVGLSDVNDAANAEYLKSSVRRALPRGMREKTEIFHLRGGLDPEKLSFTHGLLLKMLYRAMKNVPADKADAVGRAVVESYGKTVDYTDFSALAPIAEAAGIRL